MKYEWRKSEKEIYLPKQKPTLVTIPEYSFFMIRDKGNPNKEEFSKHIGALYALSYAVRMFPKNSYTPEGYFEYTVYPLEGVWDLTEHGNSLSTLDKDELVYTVMIRQPEFVTDEVFMRAKQAVLKKKKDIDPSILNEVTLEKMEDGPSVQMMHLGSYDDEPQTFSKMNEFIKENGLVKRTKTHREIYLSDPRKTEKAKLKTALRYMVDYK
jgi:hypothetical protein